MEYVLTLIIAAVLAFIPAKIAKDKGHSFGLWWFYGWMLFIVAIIHVQFIEDYNRPKMPYTPYPNENQLSQMTTNSAADELKKYKELLDQGVLTEEEFNRKKEQLLNKM